MKGVRVQDEDIFLVSYPRSGNTWVRFLLANLMRNEDEEIDFHNIHDYVPEIGRDNKRIKQMPPPRIIKSHDPYDSRYPRVIYLVRDGRDVYVSFYHYRLNVLPEDCSFQDFLRREDHFPCLWRDHVDSWLYEQRDVHPDLITLRYEDLLEDAGRELERLVDFVGIQASELDIKVAVENSSFHHMKEIEKSKGRKYAPTDADQFIRKGEHGNWRDYFTEEDKAFFKKRAGDMLIRLGYEENHDW